MKDRATITVSSSSRAIGGSLSAKTVFSGSSSTAYVLEALLERDGLASTTVQPESVLRLWPASEGTHPANLMLRLMQSDAPWLKRRTTGKNE